MLITLILSKDDIATSPIGFNYQVKTQNGLTLVFDDAAINELINDVNRIRQIKGGENICFDSEMGNTDQPPPERVSINSIIMHPIV